MAIHLIVVESVIVEIFQFGPTDRPTDRSTAILSHAAPKIFGNLRHFLALLDTFGFTQFVHEAAHCSGNDLILMRRIELSVLTVCPVTSVMSDRFLIQFEATLSCHRHVGADVFTTRYIGPSILVAFGK